ncbi:MAG TPA: methyltransferase [Blastocatellia bacterium]|nr:methyltransferase [Blastocatellia bacterium]
MNQTKMSTTDAPPNPAFIFETLNAYQRTAALRGAIELDLFTAIAEGATDVPAIAARCHASERGTRILCDYLVINGFLTKEANTYGLTQDSALFLNRKSPAYLGTTVRFLNSPHLMNAFQDIAELARRGTTLLGGEGSMDPEHPMWVDFARAMAPMMAPAAEGIAAIVGADKGGKCKVLDIAAGHGVFGIAIARHNPQAEVTALDWKSVLAVALENAEAAGVADRYQTLPGSAFEVDYGRDYDLVLLTNFLHHFDLPTCEQLMRKVHAALKPGGRAITLEFVPNDDRVTPPVEASFSLMMLGSTVAGDAYTFAQYDQIFRSAGFARNEIHELPMSPQHVIVSHK